MMVSDRYIDLSTRRFPIFLGSIGGISDTGIGIGTTVVLYAFKMLFYT